MNVCVENHPENAEGNIAINLVDRGNSGRDKLFAEVPAGCRINEFKKLLAAEHNTKITFVYVFASKDGKEPLDPSFYLTHPAPKELYYEGIACLIQLIVFIFDK